MTPEERQLLAGLFDRTRSASNAPRDRDAEAFIADAVRAQPYAPYLLAQTVIVQEQALRAANDRLQELEAQVQDLQSHASAAPTSFLGGIGKSLFGDNSPPPRPMASQPSDGPWGRPAAPGAGPQGGAPWSSQSPQPGAPQASGGFLHGALGAAAGVAGGVLLADSIRGLFSGHNNNLGIGSGFGGLGGALGSSGGGETINNYYNTSPQEQHAQDVLQDQDQDQDDEQDAADDGGGYDDSSSDT